MKYTQTNTLHGEVHRSGLVLDGYVSSVDLCDLMPPEALTSPRPGTFRFEVTFVPDLAEEAQKAAKDVMATLDRECACFDSRPNIKAKLAEEIGDIIQKALDEQANRKLGED